MCDVELIAGDVFEERETEQEDLNRQTDTAKYTTGFTVACNYYKLLLRA